jgi:hypothetical protein
VLYSGGKAPPVAHTRENDQERSTTPSPTREHKQEPNTSNTARILLQQHILQGSRRPPSPCERAAVGHHPHACVHASIAPMRACLPPSPSLQILIKWLGGGRIWLVPRRLGPLLLLPSINLSISFTKYRGEKWYLELARVAPPVLVPNSSDPAQERARGRAVPLHGRGSVVQMWTMGSSLRGCLNFRRPYRRAAGSLFLLHDHVYGFARPFPRATRDALRCRIVDQ